MEQEIKYCPNCYNQIENDSEECPRCFTKISRNLENFLLAKYKLFTLIGVFGALSIYLLTTSQQNGNDPILRSGSFFSLIIVIILSAICVWDLIRYFRIEDPDYKELPVSAIIKSVRTLPALIMFLVFFVGLILILTLYVLLNTKIGPAVVFTLFIIGFSLFLIVFYYTFRYQTEKIMEKLEGRKANIWIIGLISFSLILALTQIIKNQITVLPLDIGNLSFSIICSIVFIALLINFLKLMYKEMTLTQKKSLEKK
jgi:uncharacterized membrane protein YidH (DUF202 family)